jgi:hypothetical protein
MAVYRWALEFSKKRRCGYFGVWTLTVLSAYFADLAPDCDLEI